MQTVDAAGQALFFRLDSHGDEWSHRHPLKAHFEKLVRLKLLDEEQGGDDKQEGQSEEHEGGEQPLDDDGLLGDAGMDLPGEGQTFRISEGESDEEEAPPDAVAQWRESHRAKLGV